MFDLDRIYTARREKLSEFLKKNGIRACVFEDSEDLRDNSLRYLTGHPTDAMFVLLDDGRNCLVPWDENLARDMAHVQEILPSTRFRRKNLEALKSLLADWNCEKSSVIWFSDRISHNAFMKVCETLPDFECRCSEKDSPSEYVKELRAVKDEYEIDCTRKACAITDAMTEEIVLGLKNGSIRTEMDVALFAERELRLRGAERTSFDTLAAGPKRSFAIHAFPGYTGGLWGSEGLSILDYGVSYEGYASDCTITIARGKLSDKQKLILELVQTAADECRKLYAPGRKILDASRKADEIFAAKGMAMPHGLGHGTGLDIHEAPFVSMKSSEDKVFRTGNIITLEPGLYDKEAGGCRLENDVLITETGCEILTHSRIFCM